MAAPNPDKRRPRWRVSWDIRTERGGEVHLLYRTKFFKINEEHLAIHFSEMKKKEKGIQNVKVRQVQG